MIIKSEQKYVRTSPQKLREVARGIRKVKSPERAIEYLQFSDKRASRPLIKTFKSAIANAKNRSAVGELSVREVQIGEGPTMKRWRPASRGMAHKILKRTSHIRVILETTSQENSKSQAPNPKQIQNPKSK